MGVVVDVTARRVAVAVGVETMTARRVGIRVAIWASDDAAGAWAEAFVLARSKKATLRVKVSNKRARVSNPGQVPSRARMW